MRHVSPRERVRSGDETRPNVGMRWWVDTILFLFAGSLILTRSRFLCLVTSLSPTLWLLLSSSWGTKSVLCGTAPSFLAIWLQPLIPFCKWSTLKARQLGNAGTMFKGETHSSFPAHTVILHQWFDNFSLQPVNLHVQSISWETADHPFGLRIQHFLTVFGTIHNTRLKI